MVDPRIDTARPRLSLVSALCGSLAVGAAGLQVWTGAAAPSASAQVATKVDFQRDVQPLLQERCYECHGPTKQMNGYRLDRRSTALGGVVRPNIIPGSSESSRLFRRVLSAEFGTQMPPDDPLAGDEINGAVSRSLPLLQRTATQFYEKSGCVSCHHS